MAAQILTGYPSIDKPWLKYYSEESQNVNMPEGSMFDYLVKCNEDSLDDAAITYFNKTITYGELFRNITSTADALYSMGIRKGDVAALALPNIPENVYLIYALNRIGAVADLIDLRCKGDTLLHYLQETNTKHAFICDLFAENTFEVKDKTQLEQIVVISAVSSLGPIIKLLKQKRIKMPKYAISWESFLKLPKKQTESVSNSDDIACVFHTSGTTGKSKGAVFTNLGCNAMALQSKYVSLHFDRGKRMMNQVPPFLAFNIICSLHLPLCRHMQIMMLPDYNSEDFANRIINTKSTACLAGPADWSNFLQDTKNIKNADLSPLLTPLCGSDALPLPIKKSINEVLTSKGCTTGVLEGYGMTEIGSAACSCMPGAINDKSVGIPFPFNTFCIWDPETNQELPCNQSGEICMTGPTLMKEYYNNPEKTEKVLIKHDDGNVWLHSGDLGHIDEDGFIYIEGRLKRIIVTHEGFKISPFETERVIMKHPSVESCCVVGVTDPDKGYGNRPVAFVVLTESTSEKLKQLEICV